MKKYDFEMHFMRLADKKIEKFKEEADALISSQEFTIKFREHIEYIALYRDVDGRRFRRSTDYAMIGCMDLNDVHQEAYLAFLEAYAKVDWNRINAAENPPAELWSFLKKSTILSFDRSLRAKKDGIRIPERAYFTENNNVNLITTLFSQLDKIFFHNQEDVALTAWETELVGAFLDQHIDDYLDLKVDNHDDGIESVVIRGIFGIEAPKSTYKDLSIKYRISQSTLRKIKERAIKKLQCDKSRFVISDFLKEYRIVTKANFEKYLDKNLEVTGGPEIQ